jgi:hypothetical protein
MFCIDRSLNVIASDSVATARVYSYLLAITTSLSLLANDNVVTSYTFSLILPNTQ